MHFLYDTVVPLWMVVVLFCAVALIASAITISHRRQLKACHNFIDRTRRLFRVDPTAISPFGLKELELVLNDAYNRFPCKPKDDEALRRIAFYVMARVLAHLQLADTLEHDVFDTAQVLQRSLPDLYRAMDAAINTGNGEYNEHRGQVLRREARLVDLKEKLAAWSYAVRPGRDFCVSVETTRAE